MSARTRWATASLALLLASTACGGSDTSTPGATDAPGTTVAGAPATTAAPAPATTAAGNSDETPDLGIAENTAVVEIGDLRLEIDVTPGTLQRCDPDFFGSFWALGTNSVNSAATIEAELVPPDAADPTRITKIRVRDLVNDQEWVADPETTGVEPGMSQVDSFSIVGRSVTASATFVDQEDVFKAMGGGDAPVPITGTVRILCAPEG